MADEKQQVTTHTVESEVEKPKKRRTRKPKAPKAEAAGEGPADMEIHVEEGESRSDLPAHYVNHDGAAITLKGDAKLRVMTLEEQKEFGVKSISGEMGKKCTKAPVVMTFKNPKAAAAFFGMCLHAEKESEEFIDCSNKVEWISPTMEMNL